MANKTRAKIVLAALLHDIGKFWQRGDSGFDNKFNELSEQSKNLAGYICPTNEYNRFGYQHAIWTNEFLEKYIPKQFGFHQNVFNKDKLDEDNLFNLAAFHHKPNSKVQALISLADWWSAGIDRRKTQSLESEQEGNTPIKWGKKRYKKRPLDSIFNIINGESGNFGFGLQALDTIKSIFPNPIKSIEDGLSQEKYRNHWENFIAEYHNLPTDEINSFIESLIFLLKKYTWCIPSSTNDMANVSLFEHLKTTAAIADCLYQYYTKVGEDAFYWNDTNKRLTLKDGHYPTLLFGVDISGIQKFIYNISRRQAAKSLKGRSYYLQLLVDAIIRKMINEIGITQAHVLYASGGNFYMLLPNVKSVKDILSSLRNEIEEELWKDHKGTLSLNMAWIPFAYHPNQDKSIIIENHAGNNLGNLWKALADKIAIQKQQKHLSKIKTASFFNVIEDGGDVLTCSVSGIELPKNHKYKIDGDANLPVTEIAFNQTQIGTTLKDADYIIEYKGKETSTYLNSRAKSHIRVLGIDYYLFDQSELANNKADFRRSITSADVSLIRGINKSDIFLDAQIKGQQVSYGFQFYGGNKQAMLSKKIAKTFEELATTSKGDTTYLGILRMDIDGLGKIFIKGLDDNNKSFSAYATLSMLLDTFFSGYLNTIRDSEYYQVDNTTYNFRDYVNILYSGGDDVFAVGRWSEIIGFAEAIQKEFTAFTGRKDITISGGITFVRQKYPISKAALMAGEAEHASKQFKLDDNKTNEADKNALTFFGQTISWSEEFEEVKELKNQLVDVAKRTDSRGFLHQIIQYKSLKDKGDLSYIWNAAYYFKRFQERYARKAGRRINENKWQITEIENLQSKLFKGGDKTSNLRYFDLVVLAARWAELEIKFNNNKKQ